MISSSATHRTPNSERYAHVPTAQIVGLHNKRHSHREIGKLLGIGAIAVGNRLRKQGIRGTFPKVTEAQLKEALNDPAWQAREDGAGAASTNRVVCLECGELKSELNASGNHSHLAGKHHMKAAEYKRNHPGARLVSFQRSADQNTRQGGTKTVQDLEDEFASAYVTAAVWKAVAGDQEWEEHNGIKDFVVCRIRSPKGYRCGFKSKSGLHLHLKAWHNVTSAEYRKLFPKALQLPLGAYPAKNKIAKTYADRRRVEVAALRKLAAEKTPQPKPAKKKAGRAIAQTTPMKISLAAHLEIAGLKPYAMTNQLYPESLYPRKAGETAAECRRRRFEATRYFLRKYRALIDLKRNELEDPEAAARV